MLDGHASNTFPDLRQELLKPRRVVPASVFTTLDALFAEYVSVNELEPDADGRADFMRYLDVAIGIWAVSVS